MALSVRHERADERRHFTVTAPLFLEIANQRIQAQSWGLGGVSLEDGRPLDIKTGDQFDLKVIVPFQGFEMSFPARVEVGECDRRSGASTLDFVGLGNRERDLLAHFLEELVRGSMSPAEETIRRIDVPVTPLSTEPDKAAQPLVAAARRAASTGIATVIYSLLGLVVFTYLGQLAYNNFTRISVDTAVLATPLDTIVAASDGQLTYAGARAGDPVAVGQILLSFADHTLERDIDMAEVAVSTAQARLNYAQSRYQGAGEVSRNGAPNRDAAVQATRARLEIESLRARVRAAEQELARASAIRPRLPARVDEADSKLRSAQKALEARELETRVRTERTETLSRMGVAPTGSPDAYVQAMEQQLVQSQLEFESAQARKQALLAQRERLAIRSSFDGLLLDLPRPDGATVRRGEVIAIVSRNATPQVIAFVSQSQVMSVGLGDTARLYIPATGHEAAGRIVRIDRLSPANEHERAMLKAEARAGAEPTARVVLDVARLPDLTSRETLQMGLPVQIQFARRGTTQFTEAVRQRVTALASAFSRQKPITDAAAGSPAATGARK